MFASHKVILTLLLFDCKQSLFFVANLLHAKVKHASILSQSLIVSVIMLLLAIALAEIRRLLLGVTVHEFMLISICQCLCHLMIVSWSHGFIGLVVSVVS